MIRKLSPLLCILFIGISMNNYAQSKLFNAQKQLIERGVYREVWNNIQKDYPKNLYYEKYWLQAKVLHDQGAHYLALERLDSLELCIRKNQSLAKYWIEELLILRMDVYYQQLEFDLYYHEYEHYSKWRKTFYPRDSMRHAMDYTFRARFHSAMVHQDSARYTATQALRMMWKFKWKSSSQPLWHIYANYVSCLRNGLGFPFDVGVEKMDSYIDTCLNMLEFWYPNDCMDKLRTQQALAVPFYDRAAGIPQWKNPTQRSFLNYNEFRKRAFLLINKYKKLVGERHTYIAQVHYLLGMLEFYKGDYKKSLDYFFPSRSANFSIAESNVLYALNWRRFMSHYYVIPRIQFQLAEEKDSISKWLDYRDLMLESETGFFLRYFYLLGSRKAPEEDVYSVNPFDELSYIHLKLHQLTGKVKYLNEAWEYAQKDRYIELIRGKIWMASATFTEGYFSLLKKEIGRSRLLNDSLHLIGLDFPKFPSQLVTVVQKRLLKQYEAIRILLQRIADQDPFSSRFITGNPVYTLSSLQSKLKEDNACWLHIDQHRNEYEFKSLIWVITADTVWVQQHDWDAFKEFPPYFFKVKLGNYERDSTDYFSSQIYGKLFSKIDGVLQSKGIKRIYYCDHPVNPVGNPELLLKSNAAGIKRYLIHDYSITHKLLVFPDRYQIPKVHRRNKNRFVTIAPYLPSKFTNLQLAKHYSDSIAENQHAVAYSGFVSCNSFMQLLHESSMIQIFTHGNERGEIALSDGMLLSDSIRKMRYPLECVGLTACDSWNGKLIKGEGVRGMAEAFLGAGALRVVASLWKIDERSSSIIMLHFYRNLFSGMNADDALRAAKLAFLDRAHHIETHPSYWAGLVLYGEANALPEYLVKEEGLKYTLLITLMICVQVLLLLLDPYFRNRTRNVLGAFIQISMRDYSRRRIFFKASTALLLIAVSSI
jgi:CHAT domain-containing protein